MTPDEEHALTAAVELVGRAGARSCAIGYVDGTDGARWWAHAEYRGARLIVENHPTPIAATEALAARILDGAQCRRCGQPIRLNNTDPGCRWNRNTDGTYAHRHCLYQHSAQPTPPATPTTKARTPPAA